MSLEKLNEVATAVASIREALDSGRIAETKEREALAAKQKELETGLAKVQEDMRRNSISLPGSETVAKDYSAGRAMRAWLTGDWSKAQLERDLHQEAWKRLDANHGARVMTTLTPSAGGFLVPEEVSTTLIPKFDAMSVCKRAGATVVNPNGYPFKINKLTAGTTAAYAAEGSSVSASDLTLGQISLSPRKIGARTVLTAEQVQFGTPQTDGVVLQDLVLRTELLQDLWALAGTGQNGQPIGITNTTGINTAAGVSTTPADNLMWADLATAQQYLEEDNVPTVKLGFVVHPTQKAELYRNFYSTISSGTIAASGAAFIAGMPFISDAMFKSITGYDIFPTTQMTDGTAILGMFSDLWMAEWGGMVVGRSTEASDGTHHAFVDDKMHIKVTRWIDSAVIRPVSFHAITSI